MNIHAKNPKDFPVDVTLVKKLLIRLVTRNILNPNDQASAQLQMVKNLESLNTAPEEHLLFVLHTISTLQMQKKNPVFETGLMFGVTMTLAARSVNGKAVLNSMLTDVIAQQDHQTASGRDSEQFDAETEEAPAPPAPVPAPPPEKEKVTQ